LEFHVSSFWLEIAYPGPIFLLQRRFRTALRPRLGWGAHDAYPDPLVSWGGGHPSPISTPRHLRRLDIGALGASFQWFFFYIRPWRHLARRLMMRMLQRWQSIMTSKRFCSWPGSTSPTYRQRMASNEDVDGDDSAMHLITRHRGTTAYCLEFNSLLLTSQKIVFG